MPSTPTESPRDARAELQAWYFRGLLPKLARAAGSGVIAPQALEALDVEVRALLDLPREQEEAA